MLLKTIMNKKQKIQLGFLIVSLLGVWALLAFLIAEDLVPRFSLWANLVVGTATIVTSSVALYLSILTFNREADEKRLKKENEAKLFIHDNNDEIDYLPFCIYASCYDRHGHHTRKIYDNFCRLSDEMQKEVLKQANYSLPILSDSDWIYDKIEIINKFAEEYGFGDTFLYDSGKHFFNGYDSKEELYNDENEEELEDVFGMYSPFSRYFLKRRITINQYFEGYAYRRFRDPEWLKKRDYIPPGDLLIEFKELRDPEKTSSVVVAFWVCHTIENLFNAMVEYFYGKSPKDLINSEAYLETFEDRFYEILNILYCVDDYSKYKLIVKEPYDKKAKQ